MLAKSRVTGSLDTNLLGRALARPGMDTRAWVAYAIVKKIVIDDAEGVFVDVLVMPDKQYATARLGVEYAGNGWGLYAPLEVDDEVLVEVPNGDFNNGLVITRRLFSRADPPPSEVGENPTDFLLFVKPGKTLRMIVSGGGDAVIEARGDGVVRLGSESATLGVARMSDDVVVTIPIGTVLIDVLGTPTPNPVPITLNGVITSASDKVKST